MTAAAAVALPIPPRRIGPIRTLRHSMTLTWRGPMRIKHSPGQIWDLAITPIIMVTVFVFLFGGAIAGGNRRAYLQFMLSGVIVRAELRVLPILGCPPVNRSLARLGQRVPARPNGSRATVEDIVGASRCTSSLSCVAQVGFELGVAAFADRP